MTTMKTMKKTTWKKTRTTSLGCSLALHPEGAGLSFLYDTPACGWLLLPRLRTVYAVRV